jgi:Transglycosylase SLT domain
LNVTAIVVIVSRARAHILRLISAQLQDLVVSDWTARAVLRYRRLRNRVPMGLRVAKSAARRPSVTLVGHAFVLGVGFVLVVTAMSSRSVPQVVSASHYYAYSGTQINAADSRDVIAEDMLERPAHRAIEATPAPTPIPPPPTQVARPKTTAAPASGTFTPPPGSGGNGLAAIYAVFGNSPGLSWALRVANCESHYNPLAVNRSSGASGLFQFMPSTWNANFAGWNIWDPVAQAKAALVFYNAGRQSAWTCK